MWRMSRTGREGSLLRVINSLAKQGPDGDIRRLDILLEDYLHEAYYHNKYVKELKRKGGGPHLSPMPSPDLTPLLTLPHKLKLDLSVMLSASLLYDIPQAIFVDALQRHMGAHWGADKSKQIRKGSGLECLPHLPPFVRTALVCLLRRLAKKEREEMERWERILTPPSQAGFGRGVDGHISSLDPPSIFEGYEDMAQFVFLRNVLIHLETTMSSLTSPSLTSANLPFTPLEEEVLTTLPDVISIFRQGKYVSFLCRHTILILQQSPLCPPLTRLPQTGAEQAAYFSLLPLLQGGGMTLSDLDLIPADWGGRRGKGEGGQDFRPLLPKLVGDGGGKAVRDERRARDILGGKYLPWGVGLPRASPLSLSWKDEEGLGIVRSYPRPWAKATSEAIVHEEEGGEFFLTEGEEVAAGVTDLNMQSPPPKSPPPRTPIYRLSSDTSLFLHSHSLGEGLPPPKSPTISPVLTGLIPRSTSSPSLDSPSSRPSSPGKPPIPSHSTRALIPDMAMREERGVESRGGDSSTLCRSVSISLPSVDGREVEDDRQNVGVRMGLVVGMDLSPPPTPPVSNMLPPTIHSPIPTPPSSSRGRDRRPPSSPSSHPNPSASPSLTPLSPNPVTGYSGDFLWGARFILAPPHIVEREGMEGANDEEGLMWRPLSSPPVLVIDPPSFSRRVERALHTPKLERVSEEGLPPLQYHTQQPTGSMHEMSMGGVTGSGIIGSEEAKRDEAADVMSIDDSIALSDFISIDGGRRHSGTKALVATGNFESAPEEAAEDEVALNRFGFVPHQDPGGENSVNDSHGRPRHDRGRRTNHKTTGGDGDGRGMDESLPAAQFALLKSLGTIKNMRTLQAFNSQVKKLKLGDVRKGGTARLGSRSVSSASLSGTKWNEREEVVKSEGGDGFFLTHVCQAEFDDAADQDDGDMRKEVAEDVGDGESLLSSQLGLDAPPYPNRHPRQSSSPPKAILLRSILNYEGIYEGTGSLPRHPQEVTMSGKVLHPAFHPVYPNPPLAMDPAHALSPQRGLNEIMGVERTLGASGRVSKRAEQGRLVLSKSMDALHGLGKELDRVADGQGNSRYPQAHTPHSRNLEVIHSNPLLSSLLTKTLPPSLSRSLSRPPLPKRLVVQESISSRRSSSVISNGNSTFQEDAIYEAYSPQVLSSSQVDGDPPSLSNLQHSLTYSRGRLGTIGSNSDRGVLPEGSASQSLPQMPSLMVPRSQPPLPQSVILSPLAVSPSPQLQWTGGHRGATHKLALNRSFRVTMKSRGSKSAGPDDLLICPPQSS